MAYPAIRARRFASRPGLIFIGILQCCGHHSAFTIRTEKPSGPQA
jgi:hypothetical protein